MTDDTPPNGQPTDRDEQFDQKHATATDGGAGLHGEASSGSTNRRRFIRGLAAAGTALSFTGATVTTAAASPANLQVDSHTEYSVSLSWEPSGENADRYNVYVDPGEKMHPWQANSSYLWIHTTDTEATVHGLNNGTDYEFFVTAVVDGGESEPTNTVAQTTAGTAPTYEGPPQYPTTGMPQYGQWAHSLIGAGGKTTGIETCPSNHNVVYLRTDASGTYRSDDKGENWYMIRTGYASRGFSVDPRDEDNVVLVQDEGIYHSDQVGANYGDDTISVDDVWNHRVDVTFPHSNGTYREFGTVVARKPDDPDTLIATSEDAPFYRSTDNGQSWEALTQTPTNLHPSDVRYDPHNPSHVYVCAQAEDRSADQSFDPGLYRSTDGGDTWEQLLADPSTPPVELRFDPQTDAIYGLFGQQGDNAGENEVRRSTDGGQTWESWGDGLTIDGQVASIEVNHHDEHVYVIPGHDPSQEDIDNGEGFIFRLPPGGATWERHAPVPPAEIDTSHWWDDLGGSPGFDGTAGLAFDQQDPQKWYLSATYAVYTSPNAGQRWRYASKGIEEMVGMIVRQDPTSDRVHCGIADMQYFQMEADGEMMQFREEPDIHNIHQIAVSPADPGKVYTASAVYSAWPAVGRISISQDYGETWEPLDHRDAGLPVNKEHGLRWYTQYNGGEVSNCITGLSAHPKEPDHVVCGVSEPAEYRADGGAFRSTDGGQTWAEISGDLIGSFEHNFWMKGRGLAISGDGTMIAAPNISGPVQRWDPTQEDWFECLQDVAGNPWDVARDPNNDGRFVVALVDQDGGVYETLDGGQTWEQLRPEQANAVAYDPSNPNRIAVGLAGENTTLYSDDYGQTWQELDEGMSGGGDHMAFAGGRLIVGAGGSSYFFVDLEDGDDGGPVASFTAQPTEGDAPLEVTFDASGSSASDGSIQSYEWAFGDGNTASGEVVSHTYQEPGDYTAQLTVTDDGGNTDTDNQAITVTDPQAGADPTIESFQTYDDSPPNNPHVEIVAEWTVAHEGGGLETVVIDVADSSGQVDSATTDVSGESASGTDVFDVKQGAGETYEVTLTVTDADGDTASESRTVSS